jgi:hypothetical protein
MASHLPAWTSITPIAAHHFAWPAIPLDRQVSVAIARPHPIPLLIAPHG